MVIKFIFYLQYLFIIFISYRIKKLELSLAELIQFKEGYRYFKKIYFNVISKSITDNVTFRSLLIPLTSPKGEIKTHPSSIKIKLLKSLNLLNLNILFKFSDILHWISALFFASALSNLSRRQIFFSIFK